MLENSVIERVARGDRRAFEQLHGELYERMFYYVFKMIRDKALTEDMIQEAFVLFWSKRESFREVLAVKTYLYSILRNKVMARMRDEAIHRRILEKYEPEEDSVTSDRLLLVAEICGEVQKAIWELPPQTRQVIQLSMQDMTVEKVARAMQISPNTVKTLKKAGYQALREKLGHLRTLLFFLFC